MNNLVGLKLSEYKKIKFTVVDSEYDYQLLDFKILEDGLISPEILARIALPEELQTNKGVVISGKAPVWLYSYLVHELHPYAWVATFDPRKGGIIVQNHIPEGRTIGSIIPIEEIKPLLEKARIEKEKKKIQENSIENLVVVIGGPPHSGKSVFIQALRNKLQAMNPTSFNDGVFIIRACPDGEGDWFGDIPESQGKLIRYPGIFTDEFANEMSQFIENTTKTKKIIIVDVGGRLDKKNNLIFSKCNTGIIVSRSKEETLKWMGAYELSELKLLAIVNSVLDSETKLISNEPLELQITSLERNKINEVVIPKEMLELFKRYL